MRRETLVPVLQKVAIYAILVVAVIASVLPLMWAFASSLRPAAETFSYTTPFTLEAIIPTRWDFTAYADIIEDGFARNVFNSLLISGAVVLGGLFINSLAAFGFAVFDFRGKRPLFALVLATFLVSLEVIVVPLFLVVRELGLIDSYAALVLPALADAFAIFLLTQAFLEVPRDLIDAARVDGSSWFTVYRRVTLPLTRPALATAGLFMFIASWDAFFWPLVATRSAELGVVQLGVNRYITNSVVLWDRVFASSVIASLIVLVLFLLLQRFYIRGIALTGLK
jgi:ABC-type glycerol-3-phosphate transport system permease component